MNILHIDCSPRPESHSRRLSAAIIARLRAVHPAAVVTRRDLGVDPVPHASAVYATALASPGAQAAGAAALDLSEMLIHEVEAADILVIGTPMNNFTVPSVLKAWIDQIVRIGRTFTASSAGKTGLLRDRPVFFAVASGGVFAGARANQPDFLTPYLQAAFGCVGLHRLHILPLQATAFLSPAEAKVAQQALLPLIDDAMAADTALSGETS